MSFPPTDDARWMAAALALSARTRGRTAPNPNVGCVIVRDGIVVGRGWTQPGGRPHAEAMALRQAGEGARGAIVYVTLEPCAHASPRGGACADALVEAAPARVVAAIEDPDPRTRGAGFARLRAAGIAVETDVLADEARRAMAGFLTRQALGRPHVTLKLALSLDGAAAMADGRSRWITGAAARAHAHLERSRHEAILVGRGTWAADRPKLDVRVEGLEGRSPRAFMLSTQSPFVLSDVEVRASHDTACSTRFDFAQGERGAGGEPLGAVEVLGSPEEIAFIPGDHLLVEGGARTAASFLAADLVDRLLLYRSPILIGGGRTLPDIGLHDLGEAHGRWALADARMLGSDRLEVYERRRS